MVVFYFVLISFSKTLLGVLEFLYCLGNYVFLVYFFIYYFDLFDVTFSGLSRYKIFSDSTLKVSPLSYLANRVNLFIINLFKTRIILILESSGNFYWYFYIFYSVLPICSPIIDETPFESVLKTGAPLWPASVEIRCTMYPASINKSRI